MLPILLDYFAAEKAEALLFLAVGSVAIIASIILWRRRSPLRSMIAPLVAVALIQLVVGASVYSRTDAQVEALTAQLAQASDAFKRAESARMAVVMQNFSVYRQIEIGLLALGAILLGWRRKTERWHGVGLGLTIQSALMLVLDLFAEARGQVYLDALQGLS